jgi:hypothetical protein
MVKHRWRPRPQLIEFIDALLEKRGWVAAGTAKAAVTIIEHTGQKHILIDETGATYTEQPLYDMVRSRIENHARREHSAPRAPLPLPSSARAIELHVLGRSVCDAVWLLVQRGDTDTLRTLDEMLGGK